MARFVIFLFFFVLVITPRIVHGAILPTLSSAPYRDHQLIGVPISLRTEGIPVNTLALTITYDPEQLSFVGAQENTLIGTRWVDTPYSSALGTLSISLLVPGGVVNTFDPLTQAEIPTELGTVYFSQNGNGLTPINIVASEAYFNTPSGEHTKVNPFEKSVSLEKLPIKFIKLNESSGPEIQSILTVAVTHRLIGSNYNVYVQAVDAFGIADMKKWRNGEWEVVQNPFFVAGKITDQHITLRITNGIGAYAETTIVIPGLIRDKYRNYLIVFALIIFIGSIWIFRTRAIQRV